MSDFIQRVSVVAELERIGWKYEPISEHELRVSCPAHIEQTPSCAVNTEKRLWKCQAANCLASGDIVTFIALALSRAGKLVTRDTVWTEMETRYGVEDEKTIDGLQIEKAHEKIWSAGPLLEELRKRGISDRVIRERRLGFAEGRITIPVPNEVGAWVNIRKYLPGAPGDQKMRNVKGRSKPRLYPIDQLAYNVIIVCGGEMKALATADRMNLFGIGAITLTAGEGEGWAPFKHKLRGKKVYVCQDIDEGGRNAARILCRLFRGEASWVGDIDLTPELDVKKYPKGDINNYWEVGTPDKFLSLLGTIQEWIPKSAPQVEPEPDQPYEEIDLHKVGAAEVVGRNVKLKGTVSAMDTVPYLVPKVLNASCDRDQSFCDSCPVMAADKDEKGFVQVQLRSDSPAIIAMVGTPEKVQRQALLKGLGMPPCKTVRLKPIEHYSVEDVRLSPQLDFSSRGADSVVQPALYVGKGMEVNASYKIQGRVYPRPDNQQAILLICQKEPAEDALSDLKLTAEQLEGLKIFQSAEGESLQSKLDSIYEDLEANVTKIYKRRAMHIVADLAWHSPLLMKMNDRIIKAWTEVLILGDSSQGKSDMLKYLLQHYGLGHKVDCKSATIAGLMGGLTPMGSRWMISWGFIPRQDKRLCILEEFKGMKTEVVGALTEMRSSGIAEVNKVEKWRTHARTRLIANSNCRSNRAVAQYNFGVEAIVELVGALEDLRRFDMAIIVAEGQVNATDITNLQEHPPVVQHKYTAELCRRLILWGWTRTEDQVIFPQDTLDEITKQVRVLTNTFTEAVPLIDKGGIRYKLARLAAALAVRTFSCSTDMQSIVVKPEHVTAIAELMQAIYSDKFFGYRDYSEAVKASETLQAPEEVEARVMSTPFPKDFCESVLHTIEIECRDLSDWCGWERGDSIELLSFLVRRRCLIRDGRSYRKTASFIELLKTLLKSTRMATAGRPAHIREKRKDPAVQPGSHNEY